MGVGKLLGDTAKVLWLDASKSSESLQSGNLGNYKLIDFASSEKFCETLHCFSVTKLQTIGSGTLCD